MESNILAEISTEEFIRRFLNGDLDLPSEETGYKSYSSGYSYTPPVQETSDLLFVFGSLLSGFSLNCIVSRDNKFIGRAKTKPEFKMINIDDKYPAVLAYGKKAIVGEVYQVLPRTLDFLDSIERCPTTHRREVITLEDGITKANIYVMHKYKAPTIEEEISSGDWKEWKKDEKNRIKVKREKRMQEMANEVLRRTTLNHALNGSYSKNKSSKEYIPVYDSDTQKFIYSEKEKSELVKPGPEYCHINDVPIEGLKSLLKENGVNATYLSDGMVRINCQIRYGIWYKL